MAGTTSSELYGGDGRPIALGAELGRGGEGSVFDVGERRDLVAKLYHQDPDAEKGAKLAAMVRLGSARLLRLATWPVETLHREPGGPVVGFLMPRIGDHQAIHTLYSPRSRLVAFPLAGWPFLIHAATNIARAFAVIHEHGHVIGDVNHGNLVVSQEAIVKLIDCDSFQITSEGHHYLCEVGVSTHTPPELQGRPFRGVLRTINHDAFGLAVLLFQLLLMGRHPFSGHYTGAGELPLEQSISEYRFAYGPGAAKRQMKPPPGTLALEALSPPVAALFERAFSPEGTKEGGRPLPQEWVGALGDLAKALRRCDQNATHHYLNTLATCPWCAIESRAGILLFGYLATVGKEPQGTLDLAAIWAQIVAVPSPGPGPTLPDTTALVVAPSATAIAQAEERRFWWLGTTGIALAASIGLLVVSRGNEAAWLFAIFAIAIGNTIYKTRTTPPRKSAEEHRRDVAGQDQRLRLRWERDATAARFTAKLRELKSQQAQYEDLPALRQRKLQQLDAERQERQRQHFLDTFRLEHADVGGIGPGRVATLQSYGIETAADVARAAIEAVPGFGPALTGRLLDWRRSIEEQFNFNPAQGIDPREIARVEHEVAAERARLAQALQDGPAALQQIGQQARTLRASLLPRLEESSRAVAQAEADLRVLKRF